ncbi:thioredoxin [Mesorhizobium sp. M4B.F.Ca.ET.215.01.1.1]|uniref:thioredoxin n=2 Tax=Mesorhizobium TaxID=68287 RepID=UPI000FCA9DFE|nr:MULTISPECIES: thioredoxin [unclassified Mesorhizobium]RUW20777.1 thioredoxin [Mesorhizobium sp. M4B.F.Ca.ET.013.02.1.1]RVD40019.1 thioredoxin [Mesorhizobium sp. M4B.F.Ca.ET.019.03.1.1]RWX64937.1 thioredoxin [Mesorhizobium sp. M4B.F.Ca.ET.089.01.1.1]TGQ04180.1 thioredoxin [Mesorhizobium sp. M4B.F.Ca.ET.215.01.1.1]TGQ25077.1 thioredoxin [Mesorhizobium sp. M00.F.Ca.ET.220.01.1.1]
MSDNNPFGSSGGQYATTVQYGGGEPKLSLGEAPADLIKDTTTAGFAADVVQESRRQPVLVDFWAPWCGPCKQLTPQLEKAVKAAGGSVKLVKMNIDDHPSIAGQLGIQSIPAVIAFKNGQPVDGFMGAIPESQIAEFIKKVGGKNGAGNQVAEALAAAAEARGAGDAQTAADIYDAILEQAPETIEAIAGLGELLFEAGDTEGAEAVLARAPEDKKDAPPLAALRARIALAAQAASLGNPAEFERRLAANPADHQARFDLSMIQNARGERTQAADNLLAIIKADRSWNDDGAKAQLLKFFEAWGMTDEATLAARRKLSSLLFS